MSVELHLPARRFAPRGAASSEDLLKAKGPRPYPGGHILSFDLESKVFEDIAMAPEGEGILTMICDFARGKLYCLTWPSGLLLGLELGSRTLKRIGPIFGPGEPVVRLCRTFGLDPRDGSVYWSNPMGEIQAYRPEGRIDTLKMSIRYEGNPDLWRSIHWCAGEDVFYGVLNGTCALFRFDPERLQMELREPLLRPDGARRRIGHAGSGASLGLGLFGDMLHYLANRGQRVHVVTYHLPTRTRREHGILQLSDGRYPTVSHSIERLGAYDYSGERANLFRFQIPDP